MIIDAHNHPDWHGHGLARYLENMRRLGIERTWLLTWECPADEYSPGFNDRLPLIDPVGPIAFARCLDYVRQAPERFVLGWAPDPRRPEAVDRLAAAVELYGVRLCGELKVRMMYDNPDALRLFRFCGEKKLPVTVHIDYELPSGARYPRPSWWYGGGVEALERALARCPETIFVGHGPGFWARISGDRQHDRVAYPRGPVRARGLLPRLLRRYPNLHADLSAGSGHNALARDPGFAREFLDEFQDRVLYARDCFDNRHRQLLDGLGLPAGILAKLYAGNALRLLGED